MKRNVLSLLMAIGLLTIPWTATYASECQGHHDGMMKDVKKEVEKTENGVIIRITSDNPETVKLIHERAAEHMSGGPCKHKEHGHNGHHEKDDHHS